MPHTRRFARFPLPEIDTPCPGIIVPTLRKGERVSAATDRRLAALARQAQGGDRAARNALYLALRPAMEPILARLRYSVQWREREGRSWTWDDLAQETFPIFCTMLDDWDAGSDAFAGYFFRLLGWRLRDTLRAWSVAERHADAGLRALPVAGVDEQDLAETRLLLEAALMTLPLAEATVARMRLVDGLADREIAGALGLSERTVRRRQSRAIAALRLALAVPAGSACYARALRDAPEPDRSGWSTPTGNTPTREEPCR
jgi:RNA polymerase sigma factor (sigma-70 family)